jgi:DNA-binding response OmpR family regulator
MAALDPSSRINLEHAKILLLDDHHEGSGILIQIIRAFGARHFYRCTTNAEAEQITAENELHLVLINANLKQGSAYDFISWLRRANIQPNSFVPVILITGHTQKSNVTHARDCGANVVVAKPVSPLSVLERIVWVSREKRPYLRCSTYVGPDRRFRDDGPPDGTVGRRHDDPPEEVAPGGAGGTLERLAAASSAEGKAT